MSQTKAAAAADLERYKKYEQREHILALPGMYISSVEHTPLTTHVYDDAEGRMVKSDLSVVPGFVKIFDEVLTNATDQAMRVKSESYRAKEDVRPVRNIRVTANRETGVIAVENDGDSIDVALHPTYNVWIPTMLFGSLMTSVNYDANEERLGAGTHGLGVKLTSVFSKELTIDLVDHRAKKHFTQRFNDNLKTHDKPTIRSAASKPPHTKVTFLPDYARFGMTGLDDDTFALLRKRAMDACALTDATVSVFFNDAKINVKDFERYVDLYLGPKDEAPRVYESPNERWEVVAAISPTGQFEQISWVNGSATVLGGRHTDHLAQTIVKRLTDMATSKKRKDVKANFIKDNLMIFVKCFIVNPTYSSQTKEILTTPVAKFGSKCELSDKFYDKLYKTGIVDRALSLTEFHETKKLAKTDGKKTTRVLIPKLDDANRAGTKDSSKCTLILTEGDSARTMAISGLSVVGREYYGVFPLKGKVMNVKDTSSAKIGANDEITALKKILGLEQGKTYSDLSSLRYGSIMMLADSDDDGHHVRMLLFNVFQTLWPSLFRTPGFFISMLTPIVRATHAGRKETKLFYNLSDFHAWLDAPGASNGWKVRYLKGLGSSSDAEAKEYFRLNRRVQYAYTGKPSDDAFDLVFNKNRADDRKTWLAGYSRDNVINYDLQPTVPYEMAVDKELIHFSNRDNERNLPNICDGLKESIRKILFGCLKRRLYTDEVKVAQLSGYISEVSSYHHGEKSLQDAIVGMAQIYVGANNVNLLEPVGQFGSRIQGGHDSASPRYIHTRLSKLARAIFREEDTPVLKFLDDDGQTIEPEWYISVLPHILCNGALGIGSGYSTNIPNYNPEDIAGYCERVVRSLDGLAEPPEDDLAAAYEAILATALPDVNPWFLGFTGKVVRTAMKGTSPIYVTTGVYAWLDDATVEITELPVGVWTEDYTQFLNETIAAGSNVLRDYASHCTAMNVRFTLKLFPGVRPLIEGKFAEMFKLVSPKTITTSNMHLHAAEGQIRRYETIQDIAKEWACVRLSKYAERKQRQLDNMEQEHKVLAAKCAFIKEVVAGTIKIMNTKEAQVHEQLREKKYPTFKAGTTAAVTAAAQNPEDAGYGYLTRLPIHQLTLERKQAMERESEKLAAAIAALRAKPIHHIWREELAHFVEIWSSHRATVEADYAADRAGVAAATPTKRRAAAKK